METTIQISKNLLEKLAKMKMHKNSGENVSHVCLQNIVVSSK